MRCRDYRTPESVQFSDERGHVGDALLLSQASTSAYFKGAGVDLMNIGVGRGRALDAFNSRIVSWEPLAL